MRYKYVGFAVGLILLLSGCRSLQQKMVDSVTHSVGCMSGKDIKEEVFVRCHTPERPITLLLAVTCSPAADAESAIRLPNVVRSWPSRLAMAADVIAYCGSAKGIGTPGCVVILDPHAAQAPTRVLVSDIAGCPAYLVGASGDLGAEASPSVTSNLLQLATQSRRRNLPFELASIMVDRGQDDIHDLNVVDMDKTRPRAMFDSEQINAAARKQYLDPIRVSWPDLLACVNPGGNILLVSWRQGYGKRTKPSRDVVAAGLSGGALGAGIEAAVAFRGHWRTDFTCALVSAPEHLVYYFKTYQINELPPISRIEQQFHAITRIHDRVRTGGKRPDFGVSTSDK